MRGCIDRYPWLFEPETPVSCSCARVSLTICAQRAMPWLGEYTHSRETRCASLWCLVFFLVCPHLASLTICHMSSMQPKAVNCESREPLSAIVCWLGPKHFIAIFVYNRFWQVMLMNDSAICYHHIYKSVWFDLRVYMSGLGQIYLAILRWSRCTPSLRTGNV